MEVITAILASLLTLASPVGFVLDRLAANAIRAQIAGAEELYVRLDNAPNYQIVNGRVEHVRAAGKGIYPIPELRIAQVDLETDAVDVDLAGLQRGELRLDQPLQGAVHLVLQADDLNRFIASERVQALLNNLQFSFPGERERNRYGLVNPHLTFLAEDRLQITLDLRDRALQEEVPITVELGLSILNGHRLALVDPVVTLDGQVVPPQLISSFVSGVRSELSLRQLESMGITARVLDFEIRDNELDIAVFARVEPDSPLLLPGPSSEPSTRSEG